MKAALFGLIVVAMGAMWANRALVADAYETTPNTLQLRLRGIDLARIATDVGPSPYAIPAAPDGRSAPVPTLVAGRAEPVAAVAMGGGSSTLRGTVVGPDGPVVGAVVSIERHTSHGTGRIETATDSDGAWVVGRLPGGRYRVRAWVPSLLTMGGSEVVFLGAGEAESFAFSLWGVDPAPAMDLVHAGPIFEGGTGSVAVSISRRSIDDRGVIVTDPVPAQVVAIETTVTPIASSPVQVTDVEGAARFEIGCGPSSSVTDPGTLTARSGIMVATFPLPGCQRPIEPVTESNSDQPDG